MRAVKKYFILLTSITIVIWYTTFMSRTSKKTYKIESGRKREHLRKIQPVAHVPGEVVPQLDEGIAFKMEKLISHLPNVPVKYVYDGPIGTLMKRYINVSNVDCKIQHPTLKYISFSNRLWQYTNFPENRTQAWFFSAYIDKRNGNPTNRIRIIFVFSGTNIFNDIYCYFWFKHENSTERESFGSMIVQRGENLRHIARDSREHHVSSFYCKAQYGPKGELPVAVSIGSKKCTNQVENVLTLENKYQGKEGFLGACLKQLYTVSEDRSSILLEWIEMQKALGVEKIFVYVLEVHPNMKKVLEFYQAEGYVDIIPVTLPGEHIQLPWWPELIFKTENNIRQTLQKTCQLDCFYRANEKFKYLMLCDSDEIILPRKENNLPAVINKLVEQNSRNNTYIGALYFTSAYFPTKFWNSTGEPKIYFGDQLVPNKYLHTLKYIYRTEERLLGKSIYSTQFTSFVDTHRARFFLERATIYDVDYEECFVAHYRLTDWPASKYTVKQHLLHDNIVLDKTLWRYKDQVIPNILNVTRILNLKGYEKET